MIKTKARGELVPLPPPHQRAARLARARAYLYPPEPDIESVHVSQGPRIQAGDTQAGHVVDSRSLAS
jgi:hypothetical protein